ncbi:MAG: PD40 domain-containing protein [Crocinitomicaceae bacterium]|nr:PD40 domain-containing protein [Crocinitomicaceae bacterium]
MRKKIIPFLLTALVFQSCYQRSTSTKTVPKVVVKERVVNYRDLSVPEEGGTKFTKFTDETDVVIGPNIKSSEGVIDWYAAPFLSISPDGKKVAYIGSKNDQTNIYIKSTEGGKSTVQRTFRNNVIGLCFSRDGEYIAFTESMDSDLNIYQIKSEQGAAIQQITSSTSAESAPVYNSDFTELFYCKGEYSYEQQTTRYYIWSYNIKSSLSTQYTEGFSPDISKDNSLLVINRNNKETGLGEIWTINVTTGQETLILSHQEMGFSTPRLSPDGKKVLCVGSTLATRERMENLDLYIVNIDGTQLTQLTFHPGHDVSPEWSPDGSKIYFLSQRGTEDGGYNVWMIDYNL